MIKITKQVFTCDKCGKEFEFTEGGYNHSSCWSFTPNHEQGGYGSKFDGCEFKLDICDACLAEFVDTFKFKERVYETGCNKVYEYIKTETA